MKAFLGFIAYLVLAPLAGCILTGIDRRITARMQSRIGPPVLQPLYDVLKLLEKETLVVRRSQNFYITFFLVFMIFTGALFFAGKDILLVIFAMTLAGIFFVLAGFKASSPYSSIGAHRELIQMMAYEPAVIMSAVGIYMVTKTFYISEILASQQPLALYLPGILASFVYILAIKFKKSPFDLSMSHHAHQELVKGITTEFSGKALAMIEVAHWYELSFILGFVYLFFAGHPLAGAFAAFVVFFLAICVDNLFSRFKWQMLIRSSWLIAVALGVGNILALFFIQM